MMFNVFRDPPATISIREVGPRDGLQNEARIISTEDKVALVDALSTTGLKAIQVSSLVHPKAVPQLADAEAVMGQIERRAGVEYSVLVPNLRGAERALRTGADKWAIMLSASDSHSRANANKSMEQGFQEASAVAALGRSNGIALRGGMSMALGCPVEGPIPLARLENIVAHYIEIGVTEVGLADTAGIADPHHVYETMSALIAQFPDMTFLLHLHDTRGMGLSNVLAGMQAGVRIFESSIGGVGGCPFVPGATGNIATEDLVNLCEQMGIRTGIDLDRLLVVAARLRETFGDRVHSALMGVGGAPTG